MWMVKTGMQEECTSTRSFSLRHTAAKFKILTTQKWLDRLEKLCYYITIKTIIAGYKLIVKFGLWEPLYQRVTNLAEAAMLQNDWLLKREAEEQMKTRLREVEGIHLAKLAAQAEQRPHFYQPILVKVGVVLSRTGAYLQVHFSSGPSIEPKPILASGIARGLSSRPALSARHIDCP